MNGTASTPSIAAGPMKRQRGHGLASCLLGLALGLLVLQALFDTLACVRQTLLRQRLQLDALQAQDIAQALLRAVARAPARGSAAGGDAASAHQPPLQVAVSRDPAGEVLHADFVADGAPGACGEAQPVDGRHHAYRLRVDASGVLQCGVDGWSPQPVTDGLGRWRLDVIEDRGAPAAPRLRRVAAAQVHDWRRVLLLRACLIGPAGAPGQPACHWVDLAAPASPVGS